MILFTGTRKEPGRWTDFLQPWIWRRVWGLA